MRPCTIVDVAAVKFRIGAIKLVEKLIFDVTYEKIGVARNPLMYDGKDLTIGTIILSKYLEISSVGQLQAKQLVGQDCLVCEF